MNLLSKIWSWIKSFFVALNKEPENSVLDVGIPADPNGADDASTDTSSSVVAPVDVTPAPDASVPVQDPSQSN